MQLFKNISCLDLGEGEAGQVSAGGPEMFAWDSCRQEESMSSHRKILIDIIVYRRFIGDDNVSYPQGSGQLVGGSLILHGLYCVPKLLGISATGSKFL